MASLTSGQHFVIYVVLGAILYIFMYFITMYNDTTITDDKNILTVHMKKETLTSLWLGTIFFIIVGTMISLDVNNKKQVLWINICVLCFFVVFLIWGFAKIGTNSPIVDTIMSLLSLIVVGVMLYATYISNVAGSLFVLVSAAFMLYAFVMSVRDWANSCSKEVVINCDIDKTDMENSDTHDSYASSNFKNLIDNLKEKCKD